jgi:5,10-methylenetetrahydromethanopterin reductase
MRFAMTLFVTPAMTRADGAQFMEIAKMADSYGVLALGTGDTSFRLHEANMRVTMMALATDNALVGMKPTNPLTREPQVTAAFLASIDSLTGGRAFMDIASGDSAVRSMGYRPATRARIREYVACVRDLLATGQGHYQGRVIRTDSKPRPPVRISVCAEGPKMLALAGEIGDGVSVGMGLTPEVVAGASGIVRTAAESAGRKADEVDIWFTCRTAIDRDRDEALHRVRASLSSILRHSMGPGVDGRFVDERYHAKINEYVSGYVLDDHHAADGANARRMEDLGLTQFALERWGIAGDPADWRRRLEGLEDSGITSVWINASGSIERLSRTVTLLGTEVFPHFQ